jgi:cell division protein ZapB
MNFLNYSWVMDADIKELEVKLAKLVDLCASLRAENMQLREKTDALNSKIVQASTKLEGLLSTLPENEEVA